MAAQQPAAQQVDFSGHFVGSAFAVGDHAVANTYNGTVIQRFAPGTMPRPLPRGRPQRRPPRDPVDLLGRGAQLMQVDAALGDAGGAIAFHAPAGAGKTVLLKHVALGTGHAWPDGVVYLRVGGQAPEDVLQWLFTVFWDTGEVVYAPGPAQVGEYLRDIRALVVLDDADLGVPAVEQLLNAAHSCGFVLGAAEPVLAGGAHRLGGLDADAARRLFARVLGREPAEDERAAVDALIAGVEGLPGYVVTAAELVRDGLCSAADLIDAPRAVLVRRRVQALPAAQRELLALLAELAPAPLPAGRLPGLGVAPGADAEAELERLRADGLVERHSPRYTLAGAFAARSADGPPAAGDRLLELLHRLCAEPAALGAEELDAAVAATVAAQRAGRGDEALRAARALTWPALRLGRTGAWGTLADLGLAAAAAHGARPADEALFLHEAGTRAGCLRDHDTARRALTRARDLRRSLGDEPGVAVTEHNMRELFGPPGGGADDDGGGGGGRPGPRMIAVGLAALAAGVGIAVIALGHDDGSGIDNAGAQVTTATVDGGSDRTPPTIVISRPRSGEQLTAGSRVAASYACNDGGKPAKLCEGTVADGAPIATTEGDHRFHVRARDAAGNEETVVVRYSAVAGPTTTTTTTTKVTPATIDIRSPADGRTYPADSRITADFSCTPADPCRADVAPGAAVPADPGPHDFTVTAADSDGSPRTATASYTVQAPPDPGPPAPSAEPAPGTYAAVDVTYACTGGTAPVTCSATLDGKPFTSGAAVPCNTHTIVVTAQDARHGATSKSFTYTVDGDQCTVIR